MGKIRRKFDVQFKIQVCQAIEAGSHTVLNICQEHQLQRPIVEAWLNRYLAGNLITKSSNREAEQAREIEKLKAKVGELTMTVDLLKKMEDWKRQRSAVNSSIITSKNLAQFQKPAKQPESQSPVIITKQRKIR